MTPLGPEVILGVFVLFCRIGAAMLLMPGISSSRIPARVRLFLAIAISLALAPLLMPVVRPAVAEAEVLGLAWLIGGELLLGLLIGLLARLFFMALQALASVASMAIGYGGMPGAPIEDEEPLSSLVSLITISAVVLIFVTELHWELIYGLVESYSVLPPPAAFDSQFGLIQLADQLSETFFVALQISSPFIIYAVVVNLAVGVANKLTPQIPVYFVALPLILMGGLFLFYFTIDEMLRLFTAGFASWTTTG